MSTRNEAVLKFMKERRSVPSKSLAGPAPSLEEVKEILSIASRVPDHGKLAPWRFTLLSSNTKKRFGEAILARALEKNPELSEAEREIEIDRFPQSQSVIAFYSAPKAHPKVPQWEQELSAGAAGMNLIIAANALGYDAQWYTGWYAFDENLLPIFDVQESEKLAGFFHLGTKTMPKTERPRPEISDIFQVIED